MVSGFDKAFIIQDDSKFTFEERKLIKKFVKAKHCKRYVVDGYTKYILIDDSIKSEEYLKENYPNIYLKLEVYKEEMKNRYLVNKMWFNWQALRNYEFLLKNYNKKRIYVPTLDRHNYNRFSLGEEGLLPAGDVLFIQPFDEENLYFLLGYLNSSFFRKYYLENGGRRGGRIVFTQKFLENAKIPIFENKLKDEIIKITLEILDKKNKNDISNLENEMDNIINKFITLKFWS